VLLDAVFYILLTVIDLYWWAVFIAVIVQLLTQFQVLDTRNRIVWTIADFLYRITEPALRPIRNRLPAMGGLDLSPLVLLIGITALGYLVRAVRNYMIASGLYF
jgi:YggT family protein